MPDTVIDWLNAYNRMFQQAAQPLIAYNLEKRRLAEEARLRRQQLEDEYRKRGYQVADIQEQERYQTERDLIGARRQEERDLRQQEFELKLQEAATRRAIALREEEYKIADKAKKDEMIRELEAKAAQLGIPRSKDTDFDAKFQYYNKEVNRVESGALVGLVREGVKMRNEFSRLTGSTADEQMALQMNILLGPNYADATKALSPEEKLQLARDPSYVVAIQNRLATDKSKKGRAAFDAFDQAVNEADAQATALYAKRNTANKERLEILKGMMAEHRSMVSSKFKDAAIGPDAVTSMFSGMLDEMKSQKPPASAGAQRPPPGAILNTTPAGPYPAVPVAPGQLTPPVVPSVQEQQYLNDIRNPLINPPVSPLQRGWSPKLMQVLGDEAAMQGMISPTAFPPLRVPGMPGAVPP